MLKILIFLVLIGIVISAQKGSENSITREVEKQFQKGLASSKSFLNAHYLQEIKNIFLHDIQTGEIDIVQSCDTTDKMIPVLIKVMLNKQPFDLLGVCLLNDIEGNNNQTFDYFGEKFINILKTRVNFPKQLSINNSNGYYYCLTDSNQTIKIGSEDTFGSENCKSLKLKFKNKVYSQETIPSSYLIQIKIVLLLMIIGLFFISLVYSILKRVTKWKIEKNQTFLNSKFLKCLECFDPIENLMFLKPRSYSKQSPFDVLNGYRCFFIYYLVIHHTRTNWYPLTNFHRPTYYPQILLNFVEKVNSLACMFMITGLLTSYLTLSRNYQSGKQLSYLSDLLKRASRLLVPAKCINSCREIVSYLSTNVIIQEKKLEAIRKTSDNILNLFIQPNFFFFNWYIRADLEYLAIGLLLLKLYMRNSQTPFASDSRKKFYMLCSILIVLSQLHYFIPNSKITTSLSILKREIQYLFPYLIGLMCGVLYFEYNFAEKIDGLKNSIGFKIFNLIKTSKTVSRTLIVGSITVIMYLYADNSEMHTNINSYSGATMVLMCGAFVGKFNIYYKIYGHWILEILNNFALEHYLVHFHVIYYYFNATDISYQLTTSNYLYNYGMVVLYTWIYSITAKFMFTMPLGRLIDLGFYWSKQPIIQQPHDQNAASNQTQVETSQNLLEKPSQTIHEKQD